MRASAVAGALTGFDQDDLVMTDRQHPPARWRIECIVVSGAVNDDRIDVL